MHTNFSLSLVVIPGYYCILVQFALSCSYDMLLPVFMKFYHIGVFLHYLFLWNTTILGVFLHYLKVLLYYLAVLYFLFNSYDMLLPVFVRYYDTWCIFALPEGITVQKCSFVFPFHMICYYLFLWNTTILGVFLHYLKILLCCSAVLYFVHMICYYLFRLFLWNTTILMCFHITCFYELPPSWCLFTLPQGIIVLQWSFVFLIHMICFYLFL